MGFWIDSCMMPFFFHLSAAFDPLRIGIFSRRAEFEGLDVL